VREDDPRGREGVSGGHAMTNPSAHLDRRAFLASTAAIGGGLSLGFRVPFGLTAAEAAEKAPEIPEINAWVVVRPDDTVVIRIARP
jgi:isoquinoline 1-oxidoreductase beta subunit